jgi:hypothetical protein
MGNQVSTNQQTNELKPKPISQILDYIATYYILTMDFQSLRKLYEKDYCDKLVVLTSDIIERYYTNMEITYLAQRVKNGIEVNELEKDKMLFFNKDDLNNMDVQNATKKRRICNGIAKFYIKIAHIFAAIVTTINPIYVYKDTEGNTIRANLYEKGKIPPNTPRDIYKLNICDNRINALKNKEDILNPDENGEINVGPKVCAFNVNDFGNTKTLDEEPGIPELMELYLDDNYDYKTGRFTGMSEKTKKVFEEDLKIFYNIFTGKSEVPPEIKKFSDIRLRDYKNDPGCTGNDPKLQQKIKGKISNKLFSNYADNLKQMIQRANKNQTELLTILNKLFVYTIDPQTNKKKIRVNPSLNEEKLQEIVVETRALIIKLYLTCEIDYTNGIKLYEAIVEQKILETSKSQIENLEKLSDSLITADKIPKPAEVELLQKVTEEKIEEKKEEIQKKQNEINKEEKQLTNIKEDIIPNTNNLVPQEINKL